MRSISAKEVVVILRNESAQERAIDLTIGEHKISGSMTADSFSTMMLHHNS